MTGLFTFDTVCPGAEMHPELLSVCNSRFRVLPEKNFKLGRGAGTENIFENYKNILFLFTVTFPSIFRGRTRLSWTVRVLRPPTSANQLRILRPDVEMSPDCSISTIRGPTREEFRVKMLFGDSKNFKNINNNNYYSWLQSR